MQVRILHDLQFEVLTSHKIQLSSLLNKDKTSQSTHLGPCKRPKRGSFISISHIYVECNEVAW